MAPRQSLERRGKALPSWSSLPPEIWRVVAEQINGRKTLHALVNVNTAFRDLFRPFLHSRFKVELSRYDIGNLEAKGLPPFLTHTRHFELVLNEFRMTERHRGVFYDQDLNDDYAAFIIAAVGAMPNMHSFRWLDRSAEEEYETCLILQSPELLKSLQRSSNLRNLSITFADQYLSDTSAALANCNTQLSGFKYLTSLELYSFYGDHAELVRDIAQVLHDCPGLKTLGLGMAAEFDCDQSPEVMVVEETTDFLESLCLKYASKSTPLALETLRLGHGMFIYKSVSSDVGNYISKLVKVEGIKTLHIFNGLLHETENWEEVSFMNVHWDFFLGCTSLHQLSVSRLDHNVRRWLNVNGKSIRELYVTEHYSMYESSLDNFDRLYLPNLSTLFTREMTVTKIDHPTNDFLWPSRSLRTARTQTLIDTSLITVLHRLGGQTTQLKQLAICVDLDTQWIQFSFHLPYMHHLTHLRLDGKSHTSRKYPPPTPLFPTLTKPKDLAYRYAQLLRSKCPSLVFIQIKDWSFTITSPLPGVLVREAAAETKVELREMEWEERMGIELFAMDSFVAASGLLGPDQFHKPMSEAEEARMDRLLAEVEASVNAGADLMDLIAPLAAYP